MQEADDWCPLELWEQEHTPLCAEHAALLGSLARAVRHVPAHQLAGQAKPTEDVGRS
jgi:hypothetical protein